MRIDDDSFRQRDIDASVLEATLLQAAELMESLPPGAKVTGAIVEASNRTRPRNTPEARAAEDAAVLYLADRMPGAREFALEDANARLDAWADDVPEIVAAMRRVAAGTRRLNAAWTERAR